jgi:hypothetical protein
MKRAFRHVLLLVSASCGSAPSQVSVVLQVASDCDPVHKSDCAVPRSASGLIADDARLGRELLEADFEAPAGGTGILDIDLGAPSDRAIRYREARSGAIRFDARMMRQTLALDHGAGGIKGSFAFAAVSADGLAMRLVFGRFGDDARWTQAIEVAGSPDASGAVEVWSDLLDAVANLAPIDEPAPAPEPSAPEVSAPVTPEAPAPSVASTDPGVSSAPSISSDPSVSSVPAGGASPSSDSGCGGSSSSGDSGCGGSSSSSDSGCGGGSSSSSSGCGGCEGDAAAASLHGGVPRARASSLVVRFVWPIALIASFNRWLRRRRFARRPD